MKKVIIIGMLTCISFLNVYSQNVSGNCYRGFFDAGYTIGIYDYDFGRFEVNTSHGFQINPYLFLGAGVGFHFMPSYTTPDMNIPLDTRESHVEIPIFFNARCNILKGKFSPFVDIKGGTYVTNNSGLYANLSVGCRIATNQKQAVNISLGYTEENLEFQVFDHFIGSTSMEYTRSGRKYDTDAISIKVGYEF